MGSFNAGCGLSNLTIQAGDRIGLVLIAPDPQGYTTGGERVEEARVLYTYTTDCFKPFLPPIYGRYNDYGGLEELEESVTTRVLESIFNRPAAALVDAIGGQREIYSGMDPAAALYMEKKLQTQLNNYSATEEEIFRAAGFTKKEPLPEHNSAYRWRDYSFHQYSTEKESAGHRFTTNHWTIIQDGASAPLLENHQVDSTGSSGALFTKFSQLTGKLPGIPEEAWPQLKLLRTLSGMFYHAEVYNRLMPIATAPEFGEDRYPALEAQHQEFFSAVAKLMDHQNNHQTENQVELQELQIAMARLYRGLGVTTSMAVGDHLRSMQLYIGSNEYAEIPRLLATLSAAGRMLTPTLYGGQEDNHEAVSIINAATAEIVAQREARGW